MADFDVLVIGGGTAGYAAALRAAELTHNTYEIEYILPHSKKKEQVLLKMDEEQQTLFDVIQK